MISWLKPYSMGVVGPFFAIVAIRIKDIFSVLFFKPHLEEKRKKNVTSSLRLIWKQVQHLAG